MTSSAFYFIFMPICGTLAAWLIYNF